MTAQLFARAVFAPEGGDAVALAARGLTSCREPVRARFTAVASSSMALYICAKRVHMRASQTIS